MKTAIYIEDGIVQLVITPESEFEKNAVKSFSDKELEVQVFTGTFYDCRGGWTRQERHYRSPMQGIDDNRDKSIILRITSESVAS
jgi:hypothetical protein